MTKHMTGTREEWLGARLKLLEAEKELTRRSDELARRRQDLPWVRIDKEYRFDTDEGKASLADLFKGRSQLLVYHFMFGPDYKAGCPSCSAIADSFNGSVVHLANHDVMLWAVSRAPLEKLQGYKQRIDVPGIPGIQELGRCSDDAMRSMRGEDDCTFGLAIRSSGIGRPAKSRRHGIAISRAQRAERLTRALSVAIPVFAYIWR